MGWESREYATPGDEGRIRAAFRRMFQGGFFSWGIRIYRAWGIEVRLHFLFIIYVFSEMFDSMVRSTVGPGFRAMKLACLFGLILLHEYGHCSACRRVGGSADRIVLWPLGGLARCASPHDWRADLVTTIGGPAVNLILMPVFAGALFILGVEWTSVIFNPFGTRDVLAGLHLRSGGQPIWLFWLWYLHATNAALFFFNVLLPMFPMDSGRIVHALLWRRVGHQRATDIVTKIGFAVAILLVILGGWNHEILYIELAAFGAIMCWQERRQMQMVEGDPALRGYNFEQGYKGFPTDNSDPLGDKATRARERRQKQEADEQAELDRILAKIAQSGMGSLSRREKRWLQQATEERRRG